MSQRRTNIVNFSNYASKSMSTSLHSIKPAMLRCNLSRSQPLPRKVERLLRQRPDVAAVIERLVDDLLAEVG